MIPRRGDIIECTQCRLRIEIMNESQWPPLQYTQLTCGCGGSLVLVQSGSESTRDAATGVNKIVQPVYPSST
jgi:hypothetical protein